MIETSVVAECSSGQSLRKVTAFNWPFGEISSEVVTFRQGWSWREQLRRRLKKTKERYRPEILLNPPRPAVFAPAFCPRVIMSFGSGQLPGFGTDSRQSER